MSLKKKPPESTKPFGFSHDAEPVQDLPQFANFQYSTYHSGDHFRVSLILPASLAMRQAMEDRVTLRHYPDPLQLQWMVEEISRQPGDGPPWLAKEESI